MRVNQENRPLLPVSVSVQSPHILHVSCFRSCCIRSKPAVLILVWNFAIVLGYIGLYDNGTIIQISGSYSAPIIINITFSIAVLISPLAGFLADAKLGRYKTLLCSSYVILAEIVAISLILTVIITSIATNCCTPSPTVNKALLWIVFIFFIGVVISFLVFLTNGIQFGMDQLHDSGFTSLHTVVYMDQIHQFCHKNAWTESNILRYDSF